MDPVEENIVAVEMEIQKVQQEIDDVAHQLKTSNNSDLLPDDIAYLRLEKLMYLKKSSEVPVSNDGFESPQDPLKLIREVHYAAVTKYRATPFKTPTSYGKDGYRRLEREGKVKSFASAEARQSEDSTTVVVYSEEYKWLKTSPTGDNTYNQKPDLFVSHTSNYAARTPFKSADESLPTTRRESDTFGVLADWNLRRFLYVVCEANKKERQHCLGRTAASIEKCEWTQGGSSSLIENFVLRDPLIEVLDQACQDFQLTVDADAFLGQGAFRAVFPVNNNQEKVLALKIVPEEDSNVTELMRQKRRPRKPRESALILLWVFNQMVSNIMPTRVRCCFSLGL
eukprot:scaffold6064_cov173-Amphora_coffeaeformis.AAC.6